MQDILKFVPRRDDMDEKTLQNDRQLAEKHRREKRRLVVRDILNTTLEEDPIKLDSCPDGRTDDGGNRFVAAFFDPQSTTFNLNSHEDQEFIAEWLADRIRKKIFAVPQLISQVRNQIRKGEFEVYIISQNQLRASPRRVWYGVRRKGAQ